MQYAYNEAEEAFKWTKKLCLNIARKKEVLATDLHMSGQAIYDIKQAAAIQVPPEVPPGTIPLSRIWSQKDHSQD